jgi:hypothetical protein
LRNEGAASSSREHVDRDGGSADAAIASSSNADAAPGLRPLSAQRPLVDLEVPGFGAAVVSLPMGATSPRPLLVATHGAEDLPEEHCALWRSVVGDAGFVLCPRGALVSAYVAPADRRYFYPNHEALGENVRHAVVALRERFAGYVDLARPMYAGFSQGATMGSLFLSRTPSFARGASRGAEVKSSEEEIAFTRAILVEGGFEEWDLRASRAFAHAGGDRVAFACGRAKCLEGAQKCATFLRQAAVETLVVSAAGAGHTYGGAVAREVAKAFRWIAEDDPRWRRCGEDNAACTPRE